MRLILVRHGETEENLKEIMQGHIGGTLTKKGVTQAKKIARRLKKEHFDIIYSSDLKRCKDTCKEIKRYHPKTKVRYVKEIREKNFGVWSGRTYKEINDHLKRRGIIWSEWKPYKGESSEQKTRRVRRFFNKMLKEHADDTVLWVTHFGVIFTVLYRIIGLPYDKKKPYQAKGTELSIIEVDNNGNHKVHLVNCAKHL
jgi:broad specificity phosphatase PhoE